MGETLRMDTQQGTEQRKRVLVADDEASVLLLLRVNLPLSGFEVVEATDGEGALALARDQKFDLIVLDVMMPRMSGFEVAELLRAERGSSTAPIVFISARADKADVARGLELGAVDYVTKPFDPVAIGERLSALIDGGGA